MRYLFYTTNTILDIILQLKHKNTHFKHNQNRKKNIWISSYARPFETSWEPSDRTVPLDSVWVWLTHCEISPVLFLHLQAALGTNVPGSRSASLLVVPMYTAALKLAPVVKVREIFHLNWNEIRSGSIAVSLSVTDLSTCHLVCLSPWEHVNQAS